MKLNEKIAWYRRDRRLSQEELAAQVGVSRQAVSKWELAEASPDVGKLLALAKAFGVTTDHLLNEDEEPERAAPPAPPQEAAPPPPPEQGQFSNLPGFIGKMVRRWGWLAGVYIALQGAGVALAGTVARLAFGGMFSASSQMMGGFGVPGGWTYSGPPELEGAVMDALGAAPLASPLSGVQGIFLGIANLIIILGVLWLAAGLVLAFVLWKRGRKGD